MHSKANKTSSCAYVCVGSGLVALDFIYTSESGDRPVLSLGGSCGNVLSILSAFGVSAIPIARIGADMHGDIVMSELRQRKIDTSYLSMDREGTPVVIQRLIPEGERDNRHTFSFKCPHTGSRLPRFSAVTIAQAKNVTDSLKNIDLYYADRVAPSTKYLAKKYAERGALVMLEPSAKSSHKDLLEAAKFAHIFKISDDYMDKDDSLFDSIISPVQIVTGGEKGLWYRLHYEGYGPPNWVHLPAVPVEAVTDPAGSGDWLSAGFLIKVLQNGWSRLIEEEVNMEDALLFGQKLAAENCRWVGAQGLLKSGTLDSALGGAVNRH